MKNKSENFGTYGVSGIKIGEKGCVEFISKGIFGKYSKNFGFNFFKKVKF